MKRMIFFAMLVVAFFALSAPAHAATPKKLGKFGYWVAYKIADPAQPVCYMTLTAKPPKPKGSKLKRGEVTLMVTHRPAEGAQDVVSYAAGTKFKPSSEVTLQAGDLRYSLFTQADTAWARDAATDRAVTGAIRAAYNITITGEASRGGAFADTISMRGSSAAYKAISKACGVTVGDTPQIIKKVEAPKKPKKPKAPKKSKKKTKTKKKTKKK